MQNRWEKPQFREVCANGECTAYSGTSGEGELLNQRSPSDEQDLAVIATAGRLPGDEAAVSDGPPND